MKGAKDTREWITRLIVISTLVVLVLPLLLTSGCSWLLPSPTPYGPRVTGDGAGGAIAVYEVRKGHDQRAFYAQKISPEGDTLWEEKGVLVGSGYKTSDSFFDLHIVSDDSGGAIIVWSAYLSKPDQKLVPSQHKVKYFTHVTKVDSKGNILWQREFGDVDHLISDGAGGAIVATDYSSDEEKSSIIKIDSAGNFPWGEEGVSTYREEYQSNSLQLASDGSGGAIVIWEERHAEPGPEPHQSKIAKHIFAQRINSEGSISWGQDSVLLYTNPEGVYAEGEQVISDGSGGAIVVWHQHPKGIIKSGMPEALLNDIYAQRVDANGHILWQENGVSLGITKGGGRGPQSPLAVSDGSGGAIIIWEDMRQGLASIYAQRIDAEGNIKWQSGGEQICYIKTNSSFGYPAAVSDGSGGAIFACGYKEADTNKSGLLVQRIDAAGRTIWPGTGVVVIHSDCTTHVISHDGRGAAIVAWGNSKSLFKSERSYIQKIGAEGNCLWGEKGILLNP